VVYISPDQNNLIAACPLPIGVVYGKALASKMKYMTPFAFIKPKNTLGSKHFSGQLII
jgi:hypothetical protein